MNIARECLPPKSYLLITTITLHFKVFFYLPESSFNLDDNHKRWTVIGIAFLTGKHELEKKNYSPSRCVRVV